MHWDFGMFLRPEGLTALFTLSLMEIVLGIDNVVMVAVVVGRAPKSQRSTARRVGMGLALVARLGLLFGITWVMGLTKTLFTLPWPHHAMTGKDLILVSGGAFLMAKSALEIYKKLEGEEHEEGGEAGTPAGLASLLLQLVLLDLVFSLDSVITAVGMVKPEHLPIMITSMVIAVGVMMVAARGIGEFVQKHPSIKILALSFLNLIGVMLFAEGFGQHVEKGYIYFAMAFSLGVELLNMRFRKKQAPVVLRDNTKVLRRVDA